MSDVWTRHHHDERSLHDDKLRTHHNHSLSDRFRAIHLTTPGPSTGGHAGCFAT
ncbi:hypothetical protein PA08_0538 [Cutibacterium modestum P08]|nr:hypothetical protein PA08_0538 [Cutibacterium modestum P08]